MFENAWLWIKRHFKAAYKNVKLGYKQYIPFFIALLVIEALFFGSSMMFNNNRTNAEETIAKEYNYHLAVTGLSQDQAGVIIEEPLNYVNNFIYMQAYDAVGEAVKNPNGTYDVYVWLNTGNKNFNFFEKLTKDDDLETNYNHFMYMFRSFFPTEAPPVTEEGEGETEDTTPAPEVDIASTATVTKSPLYLLEQREAESLKLHRIVNLILIAISIFILTSLFSVRANHYKFLYGIYASFGANSRRLRISAMWELAVCGLLVLIPALLLALGVSLAVYLTAGIAFSLKFFKLLSVIPITLLVIVVSVYMPMKLISRKEPLTLIVSDDNSNLISSPRRSFKDFLKCKFPSTYEWLGAWRFRSYNIRLALISSVFCILFISGIYLADLYVTNREVTYNTSTEYSITFEDEDIVDDETLGLFNVDGVTSIHKSYESVNAADLAQHILISNSDVKLFSGLMKYPNDRSYFILNDVDYHCAVDGDYIELLKETYSYEGDLNSIFEKENHIIIGSSYNNRGIFKYEVGDTIRLAKLVKQGRTIPDTYSGNALLKRQVKFYFYEYVDYTIGAIITDYPSALDGMPLVLAKDDYEDITAEFISNEEGRKTTPAKANTINLRVDYDLSGEELNELDRTLRSDASLFGGKLYRSGGHFERRLENTYMYESFIIILSSVLLVFIPIVWFFNQLLFYRKRQNEFYILQSISAPMSKIRALHMQSGIIMIPLSIISLIAATLTVLVIYCITTFLLPIFFSIGSAVVVDFSISPIAYILCFALTFACSMLSAYIPYHSYKKSQQLDISIEYDD